MLYKTEPIVRFTVLWKGNDKARNSFYDWIEDNGIYPVRGGGFSSPEKCIYSFDATDADKVERFFEGIDGSRKCQII